MSCMVKNMNLSDTGIVNIRQVFQVSKAGESISESVAS